VLKEALTHIDKSSNLPSMVSVVEKKVSLRRAVAKSIVSVPISVQRTLEEFGGVSKKGPVFATAVLAGTLAVKNTSQIIPLCHSLPVDGCNFAM
jgi:cyclic pyranopterin monophosphate synthase